MTHQPEPNRNDSMEAQGAPESGKLDCLANTPWWCLSAGLHVVLLLMATLVYVESYTAVDAGALEIHVHQPAALQLADLKIERDLPVRQPVPVDSDTENPTQEKAIFNPIAKESDHNETDNNEDFHKAKGQSPDFNSIFEGSAGGIRGRTQSPNRGDYDTLGIGPGGGGAGSYGDRLGGHENLVARGYHGGDRSVPEDAVKFALRWLARHQGEDGGWKADGFSAQCCGSKCEGPGYNDYDAGLTGLSLLAFLGAGHTHLSHETYTDPITNKTVKYGEIVKKAIKWLITHQDADGAIGPKVSKHMYNHAIAALALSEGFGMTQSPILKEPAQKAIDYLVAAKNPYKAWRYTAKCGENDSSVTGWAVMALKSAEISGLNVGRAALEEAKGFIADVTDLNYGKCGYQRIEDAGTKVVVPGKNDDFTDHPALTAVGMLVRTFVDHDRKDKMLELGARVLAGDLPVWDPAKKTNDYYYWYYGTLAMFQYDGPDSGGTSKLWNKWIDSTVTALTKHQKVKADGCQDGSWTADDRWGFEGGRVYATAINALTLEVFYRYGNAFTGNRSHAVKETEKN